MRKRFEIEVLTDMSFSFCDEYEELSDALKALGEYQKSTTFTFRLIEVTRKEITPSK